MDVVNKYVFADPSAEIDFSNSTFGRSLVIECALK